MGFQTNGKRDFGIVLLHCGEPSQLVESHRNERRMGPFKLLQDKNFPVSFSADLAGRK